MEKLLTLEQAFYWRVSVGELAELFELTSERVRQLIGLGIIDREADGKIEVIRAMHGYSDYLRHGDPKT